MGSVMASKNLGKPPSNPARSGPIPKAVSRKKAKTPKDPGSKLLTRFPASKAAFYPRGILCFWGVTVADILDYFSY